MRQVDFVGVSIELPATHPTVLLRERDHPWRELRFPIGQPDGVALATAWRQLATPRPLTHELLTDTLTAFGISLEVVRITAVQGRTFLAELVLVRASERRVLPCRPSDGLALAFRQQPAVPLLVAEAVLALANPSVPVHPFAAPPDPFAALADPPPAPDPPDLPPGPDPPAPDPATPARPPATKRGPES